MIREKSIFRIFEISLILKAINAAIEIAGGFVVLFVNKVFLITYVLNLLQGELTDDPRDFIANFIVNSAAAYSIGSQYFFAVYLLIHGFIKIFLVISLFKKKLWAYPTAIAVFSLFTVYELYRLNITYSLWLLGLIILDLIIILLTIHEYKVKTAAIKGYKQNFESVIED